MSLLTSIGFALLALPASTARARTALPVLADCTPNQLSLTFDQENGNFDGMSHSGTLLVLRNFGVDPCRVPGRPSLTFQDVAQHPVALQLQILPGLHHGPVIVPVIIPAGAEVTAEMTWVSNDVYDPSVCVVPTSINLALGAASVRAPFSAHICGPAGKAPTYTLGILHRDPPLKP